jgi:hypothetical protein
MSAATKLQRWTAPRIRKATPHPKPRGAIEKEIDYRGGGTDQVISLDGRHLLAHIVNHADTLDVTTDDGLMRWLLVPMPPNLMRLLEWLGADREDLEDGADSEPSNEDEPSLSSGDDIDQTQWGAGSYAHDSDCEGDHADDEDDGTAEFGTVRPDSMGRAGMESCDG